MSFVKQHNECSWICYYDCQRDVWHLVMWHGNNNTQCEITSAAKFSWGDREKEAMDLLLARGEQYITSPRYPDAPFTEESYRTGAHKVGIWSDENTRFLSGVSEPKPSLVVVK